MASNLQELRKAAGYTSAKDFGAEVGVSLATMARYEANPEKIPVDKAWLMADKLGCSIDVIVGRTGIAGGGQDAPGRVQAAYEGLSPSLKSSLDDYLAFLVAKNAAEERRRELEEQRRMDGLCLRYEHMMWAEPDYEEEFAQVDTFGTIEERRAQFKAYVEGMAAELRAGREDEAERAERDAATVEKVMAAWDRTHDVYNVEGMKFTVQTIDLGNPYVAAEQAEERGRKQAGQQ